MKALLQVAGALLVFLGIALAIRMERPVPPDLSSFGPEMALPANLGPLAFPEGELVLAGRVRTSAGAPAADALVTLLDAGPDSPDAPPAHWTYTDEEGHFRLERLKTGAYRVVLTHRSAPPRTFDFSLPHADEVVWELTAPFPPLPTLPPIQRGRLRGSVLAPAVTEGEPPVSIEGCEVVLRPAPEVAPLAGAAERRATCDAAGAFEIPELVRAVYQVEVLPAWARGGSWPVLGRGTVDASGGMETPLTLVLAVGTLRGSLLEAEGRPLEGAMVRVSALDAKDAVGEPEAWPPVVTDPAGAFRVPLLPPGRYRLHLRAGIAVRDVDAEVRLGETTEVPLDPLDPRAGG